MVDPFFPASLAAPPPAAAIPGLASDPRRQALVPGDEAHVGERNPQTFENGERPPGLEANLAAERLRNPDQDLADLVLRKEIPKVVDQPLGRHDFEGAGEGCSEVGDGNPRVDIADVEGGDPCRDVPSQG